MTNLAVSPQIFNCSDIVLADTDNNPIITIGKFDEKLVKGAVAYYNIEGGKYQGKYCITSPPTIIPDRAEFQIFATSLPVLVFIKESSDIERRLLVACGPAPTTTVPAWKQRLYDLRESHKTARHTGDFSAVHKRVATAEWLAEIKAAKATLNRANTNALEQIVQDGNQLNKVVADQAHDDILALKGTPPDGKAWKQKMEDARARATKNSIANIDKVFDEGINYIENSVPPGQQDAAATVFAGGSDLLSVAFDFLTQELAAVFESLANMLKGVWDQITNYANGIVNVVSNIGSAISSLFGL
ncbi:hypothetical protein IQ07DRAFT_582502 [Pyrenochaeta sp. DS3sAY3a]|nr:hypothetical protein IQ07DRAFT_582502 [Pyrenochaeta sp. DS3sAY3a]